MKNKTDTIQLSKDEQLKATGLLKAYIEDNFDIEIGNLKTQLLLDFISEKIGIYYYNKAVADSLSFITEKTEELYLLMKSED